LGLSFASLRPLDSGIVVLVNFLLPSEGPFNTSEGALCIPDGAFNTSEGAFRCSEGPFSTLERAFGTS